VFLLVVVHMSSVSGSIGFSMSVYPRHALHHPPVSQLFPISMMAFGIVLLVDTSAATQVPAFICVWMDVIMFRHLPEFFAIYYAFSLSAAHTSF
jgi:hypothetical protein